MGIENKRFELGDVYIDYDFESVLFRYEKSTKRVFRKFYGETAETEVPWDSHLFNEAIQFGDEIDAKTYQAGK